jgi:phosphopantothenoylcysteine decarboxylase / phosphopantothenate---cysteine ligase
MSSSAARVVVGVTGGIAAYKAAELVRALQLRDIEVRVVMTRGAQQFIQPLTFSSLTGHKTITSLWSEEAEPASGLDHEGGIEHIAVAQWADTVVIAPATAHFVAKMAHGLADDFLSTMLLATAAPVVVAPGMNVNMWNNSATQDNVRVLRARGVRVVEPGDGYLACGMTGQGRLAEIETIADAITDVLATRSSREKDLLGETVLVTAGGTHEAIDPVRYIGNRSSGRMGYAIAEAARARGAQVVLVSGPTALATPPGVEFVPVTAAAEMYAAVTTHLPNATVLVGAAAVADFRPSSAAPDKLRREGSLTLQLQATEDIVRAAAKAKRPGTLVVAFAAETRADLDRARRKMQSKQADAIVLNDISAAETGFDSDRNTGWFLTEEDTVELPVMSKREMADRILDQVATLRSRNLVR